MLTNTDCFCRSFPIVPECDEHAFAWHTGAIPHHDDCPHLQSDSALIVRCRDFLGAGHKGRALWWASVSGSEVALRYVQDHIGPQRFLDLWTLQVKGAFEEACERFDQEQLVSTPIRVDSEPGLGLWVIFEEPGHEHEVQLPDPPNAVDAWEIASGEMIDTLLGVPDFEEPNCYVPGYGWTVV